MDGNQYKANINCLWTIICDDGKLIDIKFDNFELESDADNKCMEDYLEISDEQVSSRRTINLNFKQLILCFSILFVVKTYD